jgi:SAM-dependent methyltransferase
VLRNRVSWDRLAADYAGPGLRNWAAAEPTWGTWRVPEEQLGVLPPDLDGTGSIELGCGTGYVSAWLARRGARPVGLDNSAAQLATARALQDRFGLRFPLLHANAEQVPCADASFDLAISEYGASIWCDPYAWIPEAARLLRPGGQLIFLVNAVQLILTLPEQDDLPATEQLQRPYFDMHRFGGVPHRPRRHDPAPARLRFRCDRPHRDPARARCDHAAPAGQPRMGAAVALRGSLEGPQATLTRAGPRRELPGNAPV